MRIFDKIRKKTDHLRGIIFRRNDARIGTRDKERLNQSSLSKPDRFSISVLPSIQLHGVTILHTPSNPRVDIVFLHGLTGRPDKTFLHGDTGVYWPIDLLPQDVPDGRILTFGYDADVARLFRSVGQNSLDDHASDLINDLARERDYTGYISRKILFVVHGLGGLIAKRAMTLSENSADEHLRQIEKDTAGIAFLGTPHRGANFASFAKIVANIIQVSRKEINSNILEVLKRDSQVLAAVENSFANWVRKNSGHIQLACFCEELEIRGVGMLVRRESAKYAGWPQLSIHANHLDMARFRGSEDEGYRRVSGELKRWARNLSKNADNALSEDTMQRDEVASEPCINNSVDLQQTTIVDASKAPEPATNLCHEPSNECSPERPTKKNPDRDLTASEHRKTTIVTLYVLLHFLRYFTYAKYLDAAAFFQLGSRNKTDSFLLASILAFQFVKGNARAHASRLKNEEPPPASLLVTQEGIGESLTGAARSYDGGNVHLRSNMEYPYWSGNRKTNTRSTVDNL